MGALVIRSFTKLSVDSERGPSWFALPGLHHETSPIHYKMRVMLREKLTAPSVPRGTVRQRWEWTEYDTRILPEIRVIREDRPLVSSITTFGEKRLMFAPQRAIPQLGIRGSG